MKKLGILLLLLMFLAGYCYSLPAEINEVSDLKAQVATLDARIAELESKPIKTNIKPLNQLITPSPQNWIDAYGDTLETQIVYNLAILRQNDLVIAKTMSNMHPPVDPNVPTLEARVEVLESKTDMNDVDVKKLHSRMLSFREIEWEESIKNMSRSFGDSNDIK